MPQIPVSLIRRTYQRRPEAAASPGQSDISFYPVDGGVVWTLEFCLICRDEVVEALRKAVRSGVVEYNIGSRGLKRFSLKELQDLLVFWTNAAADAAVGGMGSAIQTRRGAPTDT